MAAKGMDEMLNELKEEKEQENLPKEMDVSVETEKVQQGTDVSIDEEKDVAPDKAEAERPKPVPKANRRGSKALQAELEKTKELAEENKEKYQRLLAEFDNARQRNDKENKKMYDYGAKDALEKLLPVVDNFERALSLVTESEKGPFEEGIEKIYKQMMDTFSLIGVEPMNAEGKQFDPNFHNAVIHIDDENYEENIVVEEMQKGYMYKNSVLRHSMVKVAN